ncbi:hypothetical protein [Haloplanus salinarum]|uniref:hypothetical protein n=1 Tax=Haloplanus salinarum TaxID=1912324 RepID=UPI00214B758C|nr:hypothetical protein [Haloplanus salinarum]
MSRRRRRIVAVLALCVAASMALGVGGYSAASADRSVSVTVAEPSEAYLALDGSLQCGMGRGVGNNKGFVHNRFPENTTVERIDVTVTAVDGYVRVGTGGQAEQLGPGESADLTFWGPYDSGDSAGIQVKPPTANNVSGADSLHVEIDSATGPNVGVSGATRTYEVDCPGTYGRN